MTATSASSGTCLAAKGLDISLAALRRQDPYINNIVDVASQVALYTFNNRANEWEKTEVEGTLFVYSRLASPRHGFTIMNRLSMDNLTEPITKDLDFQLQDPFLLYRNARLVIHGIWFYDKEDCQRIAQRMKTLTQQEQALAQSQGGWLSPAGGGGGGRAGDGKGVDILQMLTKARCEYDKVGKSSSEPKEIGGSSVLHDNPNLIKPIPVKPNTQDGEPGEPRSLSLATLFGSQQQHQHSSKPQLSSPAVVAGAESAVASRKPESGSRPPVVRSLLYDDPARSRASGAPRTPKSPLTGDLDAGVWPLEEAQTRKAGGTWGSKVVHDPIFVQTGTSLGGAMGPVVGTHGTGSSLAVAVPASSTNPNQHPQNQPQHCPAIQKMIQSPRGVGGIGGTLQTVSESPENRLCENGTPQELQHHHLYHYLHHQHQHHLHHHQQQQFQGNHIQRLFRAQRPPPPSSSSVPPCCSNPPPLQQPPIFSSLQPAQQILVDSVGCSHLHPHSQHSQPLYFCPSKPYPKHQPTSQSVSVAQGSGATPSHLPPAVPGLLPSQMTSGQSPQSAQGVSSQMTGMVSPHELLQKLQLVQQEQSLASRDAPRLGPGLAPRFPETAPTQSPGLTVYPCSVPDSTQSTATTSHKFQVISPQRVPATVAPTLLLSPSVFSQGRPSTGGVSVTPQDSCPAPQISKEEPRILSRSQLQATLLHLIQNDNSFMDAIYEAYVSRLATNASNKY
ncbi:mRNA-decapping enzyme 1B [Lampris incognitus]|uniref:mRNA-decapping enzyme 1B n=1 Tax=Lampris incognitus TaxID=2546036 RepID=UPI0024B50904|nr:mRNA-decapping enzyme 1B [Lampris incognitus]